MNQQHDFPPRGLFREQKKFLGDHRQRAYCIGKYQLYGSIIFLLIVEFVKGLFVGLDLDSQKVYLFLNLTAIKWVLHMLPSVLIMWATLESTAKLRAIRFCNWAKRMNLAFLLYEILEFLFLHPDWEFVFFFVLYRFIFNNEARGLMKTVKILSPRPPGNHCWFLLTRLKRLCKVYCCCVACYDEVKE